MPVHDLKPDAMPEVLAVLKSVRARSGRLRLLAGVCYAVLAMSLFLLLAAAVCHGLLAVTPQTVWYTLAERGFEWHWVADGSTAPGLRLCAILGLLLAGVWPLAWGVGYIRRVVRHRSAAVRRQHPLEPACRLIASVHRSPGEAARTLLHVPPDAFTQQLARDTAEALACLNLARISPAAPAARAALFAFAGILVFAAAAGPLQLLELAIGAGEAVRSLAGHPPRPWIVSIPPQATDRPYIIMVTAAPTARLSGNDRPRLIWQSPTRRRVIDLEPVGRHTFLIRFGQIRRPATFTVVGQTRPMPFVVDPTQPDTTPPATPP